VISTTAGLRLLGLSSLFADKPVSTKSCSCREGRRKTLGLPVDNLSAALKRSF